MIKRYFSLFLISLFSVLSISAQDELIPERPSPPRLVNDLSSSGLLSSSEKERLEQKLQAFANETSNQIAIVIVDDVGGMEPWDFASRLGHKWGVGQAKFDNGVVVLISVNTRDLAIQTGYGLEGAIPDLTTKRIREDEMNPYMKKGEYFTALDKGTDVLMALAKGEYNSDQYGKKKGGKSKGRIAIWLIIAIVFIIISIKRGGRGGRGGLSMGTGFFLGSMLGGRGFGGGSSGGFGGGGFGGFGGGGFGGGGSSGKW